MRITRDMVPTIWYENKKGEQFIPSLRGKMPPNIPKGFIYQHSQFPSCLHYDILRCYKNRSEAICRGSSSWSEDLVLAIANSGDVGGLGDAILIVANTCGRCMNALAFAYGLAWGFPEGGEDWDKCGTSCRFCE